jgi:hypothetical protein
VKYRVQWDPDAFRELRKAWLAASEPDAGLLAFDEIETILSVDANNAGESREGELRILIVPPIGVIFQARPDIGEVLIVNAWMIAGRKR